MLLKSLLNKLAKLDIEPSISDVNSSKYINFKFLNESFHCSVYNNSGRVEGFHIVCGYDNANQETDRIWFDNLNQCLNFAMKGYKNA